MLCSGSLGDVPLEVKWRAAAAAGFAWVSVYGHEYHAAVDRGVDCAGLLAELGLRIAEVDGVATTVCSEEKFVSALDIAVALDARSITVVETGDYDPQEPAQVRAAAKAFARHCELAAEHGLLVHIEPFAWSSLARLRDAAAIVAAADRLNGGLLVDLWHHVRGPDQGRLDSGIPAESIFAVQLADTGPEPWTSIRDECMTDRRLPGDGKADLAVLLAAVAGPGPLPPIGVEVFGLVDLEPAFAAQRCFATAKDTLLQVQARLER